MNNKKNYIFLFMLLFLIIPMRISANVISLSKQNTLLGVGYSETLEYQLDDGLNSSNVVWTSSNEKVATVTNGKVTALTNGTAIITASINGYKSSCIVTVNSDYVALNSISLNSTSKKILIGNSENIEVIFNPSNVSNKSVIWSSNNPSIAVVENGKVIAKSLGTTIITASLSGKNATCIVTVVDKIPLEDISLNKLSLNMKEGESQVLSVNYVPSNATNKEITWSSNNPEVVSVDSSGKLTAKKTGSAIVSAVSKDGGYKSVCKVDVEALSKAVTGVSLDKTELEIYVGNSSNLIARVSPTYAENKNIIWESSDEEIATVKDGVITAISVGSVDIKVITEDGKKEALCKVKVISPPIENISFAKEELEIFLNSEVQLETISIPSGSIIDNPIWSSSNEEVAVVENGLLKALSIGTATITISNQDNTISASMQVIVVEEPLEDLLIWVEGYELNFNKDKKDYTLVINNESQIVIKTNRDDSNVLVKGNNNLKNGSIVTVTINDDEKVTYIINIKKSGNYTIIFITVISVLLLINLIRLIKKSKKKS